MRDREKEARDYCEQQDRREDEEACKREFAVLKKAHDALTWDVRFAEMTGLLNIEEPKARLASWEKENSEEWNRLKPWYERRLP